jgi:hypothetical protein
MSKSIIMPSIRLFGLFLSLAAFSSFEALAASPASLNPEAGFVAHSMISRSVIQEEVDNLQPQRALLFAHCCHDHPVAPYDQNCCHPPSSTVYVAPAYGVGPASVRGASRRTARRTSRRVSRRRR